MTDCVLHGHPLVDGERCPCGQRQQIRVTTPTLDVIETPVAHDHTRNVVRLHNAYRRRHAS